MNDAVNESAKILPSLCAVVDALPAATLIINRQGVIVVANTVANKTLGIAADSTLEGKGMWQVLPVGLRETVAAMQREVLIYAADARRDFELILTNEEPRLLDVHLAPVSSNGGPPESFCLVLHDASHRQEVAELKKLDLIKSNFLAMISHELRTPLTSIRGAIHLLGETEPCKSDPACALVDIIHSNSDRLIRLVNNLLEMVAIDNDTFSMSRNIADINPLIEKALSRYRAVAKAKFITLEQSGQAAPVAVDEERIVQLISYLVDNAIKFTPHGGRVTVSVSNTGNGPVQIVVSDTGCGVPAYARERVFERFYQVEDSMTRCCGGAGVGLYLAQYIVTKHGGRIWMDSNASGGADFFALFPVAADVADFSPSI